MHAKVRSETAGYKWHTPKQPQYCPFNPAPINYGKKSDIIIKEPESPKLDKAGKKYIQQVVGSFLYYARAVDMTILHALSEIASEQANPTERTKKKVDQLLDYMATNPNAKIRF